jgi:hypothetical protein
VRGITPGERTFLRRHDSISSGTSALRNDLISAASDDSNLAEGIAKKIEVTMIHDAYLTPVKRGMLKSMCSLILVTFSSFI